MLVQPGFGGVRQGYKEKNLDRAAYKKIRPITQANIDNYAFFTSKEAAKPYKFKVQLPGGTEVFKTRKEAQAAIDAAPITNRDYTEGLIDFKVPKGATNFDKGRVKIPTDEFVGEGRDKSQIFKIQNKDGSNVKYTASGAGGGKKKLYNSIEEVKKAKLKFLPDELVKVSSKTIKEGIKEVTYKNKKTEFNYHHIRQIAGGVPLTSDDVMIINQRINSALGTKYNQPLNAISAAIQKNNRLALEAMNAKEESLALEYMKRSDDLNAQAEKIVNSAIDKLPKKYKGYVGFNQFTLPRDEYGFPIGNEPMLIKKVGGMPVSKDAIDLTNLNLRDEQKFKSIVRQQAEKGKIGKIDIKEIIKTRVKQGQVKGLIPFMKELGIKCQLSTGINCMNPKAYEKSLNELIVKSNAGDDAAKAKLLKFGNKVSKAGRLIRTSLGPVAIASEIALDVGLSLYDTMDKGVPIKQAFADSLTNKYILGPELQVDKQEEIKKELLEREMPDGTKIMLEDTPFNRQRGLEFAMAKRGETKAPFMAQSKEADKQRLKERQKQMDALYADELASKDLSNEEIDAVLAEEGVYSPYTLGFGMQQKKPGEGEMRYNKDVAYDELRDLFNQSVQDAIISKQFKNIADAGGVANLAGGGIAKLAGVDSGPPPEAGPNSRGLSSLMKRGTNT